nr:NADH dehydrogenase subunit 4 [Ornithodoros hermsi]
MLMVVMGLLSVMCMYLNFSFLENIFVMFVFSILFFFQVDWSSVFLYVGEFLYMDLMSFLLIELSFWVSILMFLASMNLIVNFEKMYSFYVSMVVLLVMCFSESNLMGFYLFFESVLIPIIMMIMGWGLQPERLQAGLYMLFYTLGGSLPLLLFLLKINSSLSIIYIYWVEYEMNLMMCIMGILGFLVSIPMFFIHMWLPKAHVEAPIAGSMVLAGVLLKLGIYGMLRIKSFFMGGLLSWGSGIMSVSLLGGIIVSLICLCQVDVSALIAYSSVCHMGLALGGVISMMSWGLYGNMMMMLGHGLCSSGLFCLANMYYERVFTRSMLLLSGLGSIFPFLSVWWFLFSVINMAAPPSLNLGGEVFLIGSLLKWSMIVVFPLGLISFLSASYSLYMFSYLNHGSGWVKYGMSMISIREMYLMLLHVIPLFFWVFKMEMFMLWL